MNHAKMGLLLLLGGMMLLAPVGCAHDHAENSATMGSEGSGDAPPASANEVTYVAPKGNFQMIYPKSWKPGSGQTMLTLVSANKPADSGHIAVDVPKLPFHVPGMITVDQVDDGYIKDQKKALPDLAVESNQQQMLAGAKAKRIHAKGTKDSKPWMIDAVVAVRNDTVYVLSAETSAELSKDASAALDRIVASWKWTK